MADRWRIVEEELKALTHFNKEGRAKMVDVSNKDITARSAIARGIVKMKAETLELIQEGGIKKGDVLAVAQVAGIMGAKKTPGLIPMCHPIQVTGVDIGFSVLSDTELGVIATVRTLDRTGVEMEALTAVTIAALTVYDMCKAVDKTMMIGDIELVEKTGGKSDHR
ncbi:MAG: cyclic pyranopterin monophosphate synthase MoaC [Candidatus Aquicultor secundus]|uniref:Cyclic pyranopterin monophosphate synthase n=1 Tax=Candidatus Aquicultor secundus TaxID=1973895 RepID=A0A2M7T507_9ACTN|nr:cyclic pyranopterin monophosphate synthase MoaC [Candidatus Aquicultor secundus]NCO65003.1 cyclic pyranopterin monophosphate synthase MoaC [Solirubrobacter sp.]OIO87516.1 MAG: molybdenum cofactor biosynthesis protein C [Candidatus Aquicultor secundus]PIU26006.1 MAG: cyclic pyranopterin monophosphate synthase MoaC [Candidatus Aquicultor secundus]PIW22299.1 MAG: cyclic pyranopterin monophosphate synthase MoaC [Candidatus Aquicultor secundus]PIX51709.1 MAG: cyclic pyranopterin monophosphate sy